MPCRRSPPGPPRRAECCLSRYNSGVDLFESPESAPAPAPLADRIRPRSLEEFLGQGHLLGPGKILRKAIESGELHSMILWGPPGSGKTTLALLLARVSGAHFVTFSAVLSGVKEIRQVIAEAEAVRARTGTRTILFVDEIHRFNKAQQDAFLPHVEKGTITLIGATTENPSFEVISPLLSRCRVYVLEPLGEDDLLTLLGRALTNAESGLGAFKTAGVGGGGGRARRGSASRPVPGCSARSWRPRSPIGRSNGARPRRPRP